MRVIESNRAITEEFLSVLDPAAPTFTFQAFDDSDRKAPWLARVINGSLDESWEALLDLSNRGAGIFITVNRTDLTGRTAENILAVRALFADLDGAPLANIWNVPLDPCWVSQTSGGRFHCYWKVEGIELHEFRDLQKRIIKLTGGDSAIHDLPRVMRLPGFVHQKGAAFLVEGQAIDGGTAVNSRDACIAILPPPAALEPVERHPVPLGNGASADRRYALAALENEASYVEVAPNGSRNNALNKAAFCAGTLIPAGGISASEVEAVLTSAALKAGLRPHEIATTIASGINAGMAQPRPLGAAK